MIIGVARRGNPGARHVAMAGGRQARLAAVPRWVGPAARPPPGTGGTPADGSLALCVPARDLLARGEPHAARATHEGDQVLEQGDARGPPADERVTGQHEAAILGVHAGELAAPE